jgi:hypothetical protein
MTFHNYWRREFAAGNTRRRQLLGGAPAARVRLHVVAWSSRLFGAAIAGSHPVAAPDDTAGGKARWLSGCRDMHVTAGCRAAAAR